MVDRAGYLFVVKLFFDAIMLFEKYFYFLKLFFMLKIRIFLPSFAKERRKTLQKEERKTVGRHLPAENMGIYCVSRIFR